MTGSEATSDLGRRRAARRDRASPAYAGRRAEVLAAAAGVFKVRGFSRTTLTDVAEALQIDRASVYYYVGSKEELFREVVGDTVERNAALAQEIAAGPGTAAERLRRLVTEMMVSYAESYPFLYVYLAEDLSNVSPERSDWARHMRGVNKRYENAVVELVQAGIDDGSFVTGTRAWVVAYGVIGMVSWSNRWFNPTTSSVGAEEIAAAYADVLVNGLLTR